MLVSWSTGRWNLTLEVEWEVCQEREITVNSRHVHSDRYRSGVRYFSRERKVGLRQAVAGF